MPTKSYFSEVQVVSLLLEYAKVESGDDYRSQMNASVKRPGDDDPVEVVDKVKRCAGLLPVLEPRWAEGASRL